MPTAGQCQHSIISIALSCGECKFSPLLQWQTRASWLSSCDYELFWCSESASYNARCRTGGVSTLAQSSLYKHINCILFESECLVSVTPLSQMNFCLTNQEIIWSLLSRGECKLSPRHRSTISWCSNIVRRMYSRVIVQLHGRSNYHPRWSRDIRP